MIALQLDILRIYLRALLAWCAQTLGQALPRPPDPPPAPAPGTRPPPDPPSCPPAFTPPAGLIVARQGRLRQTWAAAWAAGERPYRHLAEQAAWERIDRLERCIALEHTEEVPDDHT